MNLDLTSSRLIIARRFACPSPVSLLSDLYPNQLHHQTLSGQLLADNRPVTHCLALALTLTLTHNHVRLHRDLLPHQLVPRISNRQALTSLLNSLNPTRFRAELLVLLPGPLVAFPRCPVIARCGVARTLYVFPRNCVSRKSHRLRLKKVTFSHLEI